MRNFTLLRYHWIRTRSLVWAMLLPSFLLTLAITASQAQPSTFTTAQIEVGTDCNWPYSAVATSPVDGKIYAFWRRGANEEVTYKLIRWDGNGWTTLSTFTNATGSSSTIKVPNFGDATDDVSLAIDKANRFHVTFKGSSSISGRDAVWYGLSTNGTNWSFQMLQSLPSGSINESLADQVIEVDPQNQPHVAFRYTNANAPRTYTLRYFRFTDGSWVGETAITQSGSSNGGTVSNEIGRFDLAIDANAKAHLSFRRETNGTGRDGSLYYINNTSGSWGPAQELVTGNTAQSQAVTNTIDTDASNNVHIVHSDYLHKLYYTTNVSGSFVTTQINGNVMGDVSSQHTLRINAKGDKFVVYNDNSGTPTQLNYAYQLAGTSGTWTTGTGFTPDAAGQGGNYYSGLLSDDRRIMMLFDNSLTSTRGQCNTFQRNLWYATATVQGAPVQVAPTVTTSAATAITKSSATLGGNVTSDGGSNVTERGVVYSSINNSPTINGSNVTRDVNGMGTGPFSKLITGLTPGTSYSVVAYATNNISTSYGSVTTFTTLPNAPVLSTPTNGTLLNTRRPTYTGTAQAGSTVRIYRNPVGQPILISNDVIANAQGVFNFVTPGDDSEGAYTAYATATVNGVTSAQSNVNSFTIDATAPMVTLTAPVGPGSDTPTSPISFTATFTESVTGLSAASVSVSNGRISGFTPLSGSQYSFSITPNANGLVSVSLAAGVARDAAGNNSTTSNVYRLTYRPPVTLTSLTVLPAAVCVGSPVTLTATVGRDAGTYSYTLTYGSSVIIGTTPNGFSQTLTTTGSGSQTISLRVSNGVDAAAQSTTVQVNPLPTVSLGSNGPLTCAQPSVTLTATGDGMGQALTYRFSAPASQQGGSSGNTATVTTQGLYSVTAITTSGCSATAQTSVGIDLSLPTPTLLTQTGGSYPAGRASVSVNLNTGNVNLVAAGCAGTVSWTGPNNTAGTGNAIVVPTTAAGTFVYQARCRVGSCISDPASATVSVTGGLQVLHRDVDNYADNNAIKPLLVLQNNGAGPLPLSAITLRYYLTVEGGGALSNLFVDYAQVGNGNVKLRYVSLPQPLQGAGGYVEYSFTPEAGSLAPGANSGAISAYLTKGDYGPLNELDDYSYAQVRDQLVGNLRITAYYNGALIAGIEPGAVGTPPPAVRSLRALTESKNGPSATQINTFLEVRNEGNTAINYSDLKVRYYFTADGAERLQVEVDEGAVQARLVKLPQAVTGADTYLELSFTQGGQLAPNASTGTVRYRILKPDGGRFDQTNDYSYQEQPQDRSQNAHVVVLVNGEVAWGTPPAGSAARAAARAEPGAELTVRLLGNPVVGGVLEAEVTGAQDQPLTLQLIDLQGRVVTGQQVGSAAASERVKLTVGPQATGLLLLQVSTPTQHQTVKVVTIE